MFILSAILSTQIDFNWPSNFWVVIWCQTVVIVSAPVMLLFMHEWKGILNNRKRFSNKCIAWVKFRCIVYWNLCYSLVHNSVLFLFFIQATSANNKPLTGMVVHPSEINQVVKGQGSGSPPDVGHMSDMCCSTHDCWFHWYIVWACTCHSLLCYFYCAVVLVVFTVHIQ